MRLVTPTRIVFVAAALYALVAVRAPWTDDARFYVPAARAYGAWLEDVAVGMLHLNATALSHPQIDAAFQHNHEHPPVGKYAMALTWLVLHHWTGWVEDIEACRAGVILLWALCAALLFRLVAERRGGATGLFAVLALATMPRFMFHAHAESLDLPVTAFIFAAGDALWCCLEAPRLRTGIAAVIYFALALGTKLNAPFMLAAAFVYVLALWPGALSGLELRLPRLPLVLIAMLVISPLVAVALWPWLWFDTAARLGDYLRYHVQHYGIFFYYRGTLYGDQVAPWHAPAVMLALTTPLPILILAAVGAWPAVKALVARLPGIARRDLVPLNDLRHDPEARLTLFALLQVLAQLVAVCWPGVPKYGGEKLFLPVFPFVAVLAALAFARLADAARAMHRPRLVVAVTALALLLPGALGVIAYRDAPLSYYNELAGGLRGATRAGFERQYYDLAYPQIADTLREALPNGGLVAVQPNPKEYGPYFEAWHRRGELPEQVKLSGVEGADLLLLTHERRWREYPLLLARYRMRPLVTRFAVDGVPLYSIYDLRPQPR